MKTQSLRLMARSSAVAMALAALVPASQAAAQDDETLPAESDAASSGQGEAIVVTGSRIGRSTFTSTTPVTVIGADTIAALGQVNVGETLQTLPQNVSTASDTNVGLTANTDQPNIGASIANLRGLNPANGVRTLTLVDTRRFVPSTTGGGVDMNLIPSILVQSIETVTGGASAAYGTDALAGVVNVILDKQLDGIKAQIDYGQTFRGDGTSFHGALAYGTEFADGRGHFMIGGEYQDNGEVGDCVYAREWCAESPGAVLNADYDTPGAANYGQAHYLRLDNTAYTNYDLNGVLRGTRTGRVNDPALRNITFTPDGTQAVEFDQGEYTQGIGFYARQGGDCLIDCSLWSEVQLRPEVERASLFARADYEISDNITAIFEASYGMRKSKVKGLSLGPSSGSPIRADNAFLSGVTILDRLSGEQILLTDLIDSTRTGTFPGGEGWEPGVGDSWATATNSSQAPGVDNLPLVIAKHIGIVAPGSRRTVSTDLETYRFMGGLEGDFELFGRSWSWDAYYQYGKTEQFAEIAGLRTNALFAAALDAVDEGMMRTMQQDEDGNWIVGSGTPNGNIVCRGTLVGPGPNPVPTANTSTPASWYEHWNLPYADGCKPLNLLGGNPDPEAIAYAYRPSQEDFDYAQHVVAFNVSGEVFDGWAGPIGLALGAEYRFEDGSAIHNTLDNGVAVSDQGFGSDYAGDLKILEGYVETNIPLLRDIPLIQYLELNGAYRRTQQTNSDGITGQSKDLGFDTWKISGNWEVTDWLRFRATRSRDVRAASFVDLYFNQGKTAYGPTAGRIFSPWALNEDGVAQGDFLEVLYPPNFQLSPEVGNTLTVGAVFQPTGALDGFRLSVDYYDITINDAIVVLDAQQTADACFNANVGCDRLFTGLNGTGTSYADLSAAERQANQDGVVTMGGTQGVGIESILRGATNVGEFKTSGFDIELLYRLPLDKLSSSMPGVLTFRGLATVTDSITVDLLAAGDGGTEYVNQTGGTTFGGFAAPPEYVLTGYLTYETGGFQITGDFRYIPEGIYDIRRCDVSRGECDSTDVNGINNNYVDSRLYTGLSASYEFGLSGDSTAEIFMSVRNLFDVDPPKSPSGSGGRGGMVDGTGSPTNPVYYDTLGARWRAGVRVNF